MSKEIMDTGMKLSEGRNNCGYPDGVRHPP